MRGTTQGTPTQVSPHIGNDGHRQRYAHRAGTTLTWTRQNRHYAALCHGQSEQREAGTPQIYWLTLMNYLCFLRYFAFGTVSLQQNRNKNEVIGDSYISRR